MDSNQRPPDYKSGALPTELRQQKLDYIFFKNLSRDILTIFLFFDNISQVSILKLPFKLIWYLAFGIGYLILFVQYYFPGEWGAKRSTTKTRRQWDNKHTFGPLYSIIIYVLIFLYISFT